MSPCWEDETQQRGPGQSPGRLLKKWNRRGVRVKRLREKGGGQLGISVDKVGEKCVL